MLFWLSHYTRAQYKTRKETNVLIIVVMYLVLLFRESLKGGWGWLRGWLSTNLISPPTFCPDSSDSNFPSNHIFGDKRRGQSPFPVKYARFLSKKYKSQLFPFDSPYLSFYPFRALYVVFLEK